MSYDCARSHKIWGTFRDGVEKIRHFYLFLLLCVQITSNIIVNLNLYMKNLRSLDEALFLSFFLTQENQKKCGGKLRQKSCKARDKTSTFYSEKGNN